MPLANNHRVLKQIKGSWNSQPRLNGRLLKHDGSIIQRSCQNVAVRLGGVRKRLTWRSDFVWWKRIPASEHSDTLRVRLTGYFWWSTSARLQISHGVLGYSRIQRKIIYIAEPWSRMELRSSCTIRAWFGLFWHFHFPWQLHHGPFVSPFRLLDRPNRF